MSRILVAHTSDGQAFLENAMKDHNVHYAKTLDEACRMLDEHDFDLILCGMQFDESRMFDFLRYCKTHKEHRNTPFGCIRLMDSNYSSPLILESLEIASRALGATAFLDLVTADGNPEELVTQLIADSLKFTAPQKARS